MDVRQLPPQVGLQFDDGGAPQRLYPPGAVEQINLVRDLAIGCAEPGAQQFGDMAAQGLVPGAGGQGAHEVRQPLGAPFGGHRRKMPSPAETAGGAGKGGGQGLARLGPGCYQPRMSVMQPAVQRDLFGTSGPEAPAPDALAPEIQALVRARLHAALALVRGADAMSWPDMLSVIREDNAFRYAKGLLPPEEGAALWAASDQEMDRLYAVMNAGTEMDARE